MAPDPRCKVTYGQLYPFQKDAVDFLVGVSAKVGNLMHCEGGVGGRTILANAASDYMARQASDCIILSPSVLRNQWVGTLPGAEIVTPDHLRKWNNFRGRSGYVLIIDRSCNGIWQPSNACFLNVDELVRRSRVTFLKNPITGKSKVNPDIPFSWGHSCQEYEMPPKSLIHRSLGSPVSTGEPRVNWRQLTPEERATAKVHIFVNRSEDLLPGGGTLDDELYG